MGDRKESKIKYSMSLDLPANELGHNRYKETQVVSDLKCKTVKVLSYPSCIPFLFLIFPCFVTFPPSYANASTNSLIERSIENLSSSIDVPDTRLTVQQSLNEYISATTEPILTTSYCLKDRGVLNESPKTTEIKRAATTFKSSQVPPAQDSYSNSDTDLRHPKSLGNRNDDYIQHPSSGRAMDIVKKSIKKAIKAAKKAKKKAKKKIKKLAHKTKDKIHHATHYTSHG